jgi:hypothetical protein
MVLPKLKTKEHPHGYIAHHVLDEEQHYTPYFG